jgi:hypothetical protein
MENSCGFIGKNGLFIYFHFCTDMGSKGYTGLVISLFFLLQAVAYGAARSIVLLHPGARYACLFQ